MAKTNNHPVIVINDKEVLQSDNIRPRKRRKVDEMSDEHIEVFEDRNEDFQPQQKRGFLRPERNGQTGGQDEDRMNQEDREQGRRKKSNSSWKQRLPMVTGQSREFAFAAPVDLFVLLSS